MKAVITIGFIGVSLATIQPTINAESYLNYNQPYKNTGREEEQFISRKDNDEVWEMVIKIRNDEVGYSDTEFANKLNWCRYVGESTVLQKKADFYINNVVAYSTRCMAHQDRMIKNFLKHDYHNQDEDIFNDDSKVSAK